MKKLFLLLLCLLIATPALALTSATRAVVGVGSAPAASHNFTVVDSDANTDANSITLNGISAGNLIVILAKYGSSTSAPTISDGTTSLTMLSVGGDAANVATCIGYLLSSVASGDVTYTITWGSGATSKRVMAYAFSYSDTISYDLLTTINTGTGTSAATQAFTTTGTSEICFGGVNVVSPGTISNPLLAGGAPDGSVSANDYNILFYKIFTTTKTSIVAAATLASSVYWVARAACFK